jgi:hypothetical protein
VASVIHRGLIPLDTVKIPEDAKSGVTEDSSSLLQPGDIVCDSVTVKNTFYAKNILVVLEVIHQDKIRVGWIKKVIVRKNKVFFLVSAKVCKRTSMRFFQSEEVRGLLQLKSVDTIKSYKPLIPRGNEAFFSFFLHGKLLDDFAI